MSPKTVFENFNLVKSYDKTYPNVCVFSLWKIIQVGLIFFCPVYLPEWSLLIRDKVYFLKSNYFSSHYLHAVATELKARVWKFEFKLLR